MSLSEPEPEQVCLEDDAVHLLFRVLRENVVSVTNNFHSRLNSSLDNVNDNIERDQSEASLIRILASVCVQASNLLVGSLGISMDALSDSQTDHLNVGSDGNVGDKDS